MVNRPSIRTVLARSESTRRWLRRRFEVDARALGALRIALGCILLVDLVHRAGSFGLFYTSEGVYPLAVHEATAGTAGRLSVHALSDRAAFQAALFAIAGVFAAAFAVGYRTRLVGAVSLLLVVSLHVRTPVVLNGGDRLLRVLLLVALLTPLGERFSVDALRGGSTRRRVATLGTAALLLQPVVVFTTNAVEKHRGTLWYAGDGLESALSDPTMTTAVGARLLEIPTVLTAANDAWVALLAGAAPLLLLTAGRLRALVAAVYLGAFVGMGLSLSVGLFPLVLAASVLPFLTTPAWEAAGSAWARTPTGERVRSFAAARVDGRATAPESPRPDGPGKRLRTLGRLAATAVAAAVLIWMVAFAAVDIVDRTPPPPLDSEHLDQQRWGLYAPDPADSYDWHVVVAERDGGPAFDAVSGGPVSFDRPPDAAAAYDTFRHRRFMSAVDTAARNEGPLADRYTEWACERALGRDDRVETVTVVRIQRAKPLGGADEEPRRTAIAERSCR